MVGRVEDVTEIDGSLEGVSAKLHHFGVNKNQLSSTHKLWLDNHVLPYLLVGGSFAVMGETSRTGSFQLNNKLSKARAQSVIDYLKSLVRGRFVFSAPPSVGASEIPAALAGHVDGTESGLYRAVLISVWSRPAPPPLPKPNIMPPNEKLFIRVVNRTWNNTSTSSPAERFDPHGGGDGAALAAIAKSIYDAQKRGGSDKRKYGYHPMHYFVTTVKDVTKMVITRSELATTTSIKTTIDYTWGPAKGNPGVLLDQTFSSVNNWKDENNSPSVTRTRPKRLYPLKEIWKHTHSPIATVVG